MSTNIVRKGVLSHELDVVEVLQVGHDVAGQAAYAINDGMPCYFGQAYGNIS